MEFPLIFILILKYGKSNIVLSTYYLSSYLFQYISYVIHTGRWKVKNHSSQTQELVDPVHVHTLADGGGQTVKGGFQIVGGGDAGQRR